MRTRSEDVPERRVLIAIVVVVIVILILVLGENPSMTIQELLEIQAANKAHLAEVRAANQTALANIRTAQVALDLANEAGATATAAVAGAVDAINLTRDELVQAIIADAKSSTDEPAEEPVRVSLRATPVEGALDTIAILNFIRKKDWAGLAQYLINNYGDELAALLVSWLKSLVK